MSGYTSILDRVNLLITANVNAAIDKAVGKNKLAVFDEYVSRMTGAWDALATAEGVERGRAKTLTRQIGELDTEIARLDRDVDRLLVAGERSLAAARQAVLNTKQGLLENLQETLAGSRIEAEKLANAKAKLAGQIEVTRARRQELRAILEQRRASDVRLAAQATVRELAGGQARTDEVIGAARRDLDIALGKEEASGDTLERRIDELLGGEEIDVQLRLRESRLKELPAG